MGPRVLFYMPEEADIECLQRLDCDRDWREFVMGERCWILQTYLRLRDAGCRVELSNRRVDGEIVVVHPFFLKDLLAACPAARLPIVVITADDKGYCPLVDFQLVQNRQASGERAFYVPLWPQPGLLSRDAGRGSRIEKAVFKGFDACLHPDFRSAAWLDGLQSLGVRWEEDSYEARVHNFPINQLHWNDFRAADLVVAVRPNPDDLYIRKPATKLIIAWLAGVPALLGPEYAYRELRKSELDYIEVKTPAEALTAIRRLQQEPGLYAAMVANGRERAKEHNQERVLERWREVLYETVPQAAAAPGFDALRADSRRRLRCRLWSWKAFGLRTVGEVLQRVHHWRGVRATTRDYPDASLNPRARS